MDLVQLHCPPTDVFYNEELFYQLSELAKDGLIANYGVSVEKVREAMQALNYSDICYVTLLHTFIFVNFILLT